MNPLAVVQQHIQEVLDILREDIRANCSGPWDRSSGYLPLMFRSVIRRQFDSMESMLSLASIGRGFDCAPLVRPSCEEKIWIKYLLSIDRNIADRVLLCMGKDEQMKALRAQRTYSGKKAFKRLGLFRYLKKAEKEGHRLRRELETLHRVLSWPTTERNNKGNWKLPNLYWLSRQVGEERTYDFIYHATSRFVHFSTIELLRRVWLDPNSKTVSISPSNMHEYWSHLTLYWGFRLFLGTLELVSESAIIDLRELMKHQDRFLKASREIGRVGMVPIITPMELKWPDDLPPP